MSQSTSDQSPKTRTLTRSLVDVATELTPERLAAHEAAYRRGVHQAFAFAADVAYQTRDPREIRRVLRRAENLAGRLRFKEKDRGGGMLLDHIRGRLRWPARKEGAAR